MRATAYFVDLRALGRKIRQLRTSQNLSQKEVGAQLGVSYQWVLRIESGRAAPPAVDRLSALAHLLGVTVAGLLDEQQETPIEKRTPSASKEKTSIGRRIAELRLRAGWTQRDLACQLGIRKENVRRYEAGLQTPCVAGVVKLAEALGVTPNDLLLGDPAPGRAPR